ncbi:hypothetical protein FRB90_006657, partial [Tulasnella sp. 427]
SATAILLSDTKPEAQRHNHAMFNASIAHLISTLRPYNPLLPGRHTGLLRVVVEDDSGPPEYIWHGLRYTYRTGTNLEIRTIVMEEELGTTLSPHEALL